MAISIQTNPLGGLGEFMNAYTGAQDATATRNYLAQSRAQQLQSMSQSNQGQALQNQQIQRQMSDQDATRKAMRDAMTSADATTTSPFSASSQSGAASGDTGAAVAQATPVKPPSSSTPQKGPLTLQDYARLDQENGNPLGTAYAAAKVESDFNPDAVSKKGAQGLFQVMPSTAKDPGYGLQSFDPKDPEGAMKYMHALLGKAGGDPARMAAMYNAGEKGDFNNPETKAYVPKFMEGMKEFQSQYGLAQQSAQPTPAEHVAAAQDAGISIPLTGMQKASQLQQQQIQQNISAGNALIKAGKGDLAQPFFDRATALQKGATDLQEKTIATQKSANDEITKLVQGVRPGDQAGWNNVLSQVRQNPAMQAAMQGLDITGDVVHDQPAIETLRDRTMTVKDQMDVQAKAQQLKIDQQKADDAHQKAQAPLIMKAQAQAQDTVRAQHAKEAGVPVVPSLAAQGGDPAMIKQAQQVTNKANATLLPKIDAEVTSSRQITALTQKLHSQLTGPHPVTTGGLTAVPGLGWLATALEPDRRDFDKTSRQLITLMQSQIGAQGGSRSSYTAAMYGNIEKQKPNLDFANSVNQDMVNGLFYGAQDSMQRGKFLREFHQANPQADIQDGAAMWESYEADSPALVVDPASGEMVPNNNRSPVLVDGKPNTNYKDYHDFFRNNYHG